MEVRGWPEGIGNRGKASGVLHRLEFWHGTGTTTVSCKPSLRFAAEAISDPDGSSLAICRGCRRIAKAEARRALVRHAPEAQVAR